MTQQKRKLLFKIKQWRKMLTSISRKISLKEEKPLYLLFKEGFFQHVSIEKKDAGADVCVITFALHDFLIKKKP
jgi:hypothetical protein